MVNVGDLNGRGGRGLGTGVTEVSSRHGVHAFKARTLRVCLAK